MSKLILSNLEGKSTNGNKIILPAGHTLVSGGTPIQFVRHEWTNETSVPASSGWVDTTGSLMNFTPKMANSKLLVIAELATAPYWSAGAHAGLSVRIVRDGVIVGHQAGQLHEIYMSGGGDTTQDMYVRTVKSVYLPANAAVSTAFKIQMAGYGSTAAARLNQASQWQSNIGIWEIAQ